MTEDACAEAAIREMASRRRRSLTFARAEYGTDERCVNNYPSSPLKVYDSPLCLRDLWPFGQQQQRPRPRQEHQQRARTVGKV